MAKMDGSSPSFQAVFSQIGVGNPPIDPGIKNVQSVPLRVQFMLLVAPPAPEGLHLAHREIITVEQPWRHPIHLTAQ